MDEPREPHWRQGGDDPDARFSLANERTFLAWIRTSLALLAGALAVAQYIKPFLVPGARSVLVLLLAGLGVMLSGWAYRRWASVERAMRYGRALPHTPMLLVVSAGVVAIGVLVVAAGLAARG